jgi:hypothetical protein
MIIFTAMIVKAKTTIMAMTIKPYESIAYTEIETHYFPDSIDTLTVPDTQSVVTKHDRLTVNRNFCQIVEPKNRRPMRMSVEVP